MRPSYLLDPPARLEQTTRTTVAARKNAIQKRKRLSPHLLSLCAVFALAMPVQAQNIYVALAGEGRVVEYTHDGTEIRTLRAGLGYPLGLALDKAGNLFVASSDGYGSILKFPAGSELSTTFARVGGVPAGLLFDPQGNLLIAQSGSTEIRRFAPDGTDIGNFASGGQVYSPTGMAYDKFGYLYETNFYGDTVRKFSPAGVDLGTIAYGVDRPTGIALDAAGNIYVASASADTVTKFSPSGVNLGVFAKGLLYPYGLAFDSQGNLFVSSFLGGSIFVYDPTGAQVFFPVWKARLDRPSALLFEPPKAAAVPEPSLTFPLLLVGLLAVFCMRRRKATHLLTVGLICTAITGVKLAHAQNLYVAEAGEDRIVEYTHDGKPIRTLRGGISHPLGLAFDKSGNLFAASGDGGYGPIYEYPGGGNDSVLFVRVGGIPAGMVFDSQGNLLIAQSDGNYIRRIAPDGSDLGNFATGGQLLNPRGLAFDKAGNLYVGNYNGVRKYSPDGIDLGNFVSGLDRATGVVFDSAGNLFVADMSGRVLKYSPTGDKLATLISLMTNPFGLAIDSAGYLFVSDMNSGGHVRVFDPNGVGVPGPYFLSGLDRPSALLFEPPKPAAVPEPSLSIWLIAIGLLTILCMRRRKATYFLIVGLICTAMLSVKQAQAQNLFVAEAGQDHILEYTHDGQLIRTLRGGIGFPLGLVFDKSGNLFAASGDRGFGGIYKYPNDGSDAVLFTHVGGSPAGMVFDAQGNLLIAQSDGTYIRRIAPDGSDIGNFATGGSLSGPTGLAFDKSGNLYVGNYDGVRKYSPDGKDLGNFVSGLDRATGLVFDSAGNLYVGDRSGRVLKYSPTGVMLATIISHMITPFGLAIDSSGYLFVSDMNTAGYIRVFDPDGAGVPGPFFLANLDRPSALAFAPPKAAAVPEPSVALPLIVVTGLIVLSSRRRKAVKSAAL